MAADVVINLANITVASIATLPTSYSGVGNLNLAPVVVSSTAEELPAANATIVINLAPIVVTSGNFGNDAELLLADILVAATAGIDPPNNGRLVRTLQNILSTGTGSQFSFQDTKTMTTLRALIQDALRESNLIPLGATPESEEHEESLRLLNRVIFALFGNELGDNLCTINYKDGYSFVDDTVPPNTRLFINPTEDKVFKLNPWPEDGERFALTGSFAPYGVTIEGNGHKINNSGSIAFNGESVSAEWFFRADLGQWVRVLPLGDNDDSPFPMEFDDLLITKLSMRLDPRYGKTMTPETIQAMREMATKFRARYHQTSEPGVERPLRDIDPFDTGYGYL